MGIAYRWPAVTAAALIAGSALAGFRQGAVHEHGTGRLDIAIEGAALEIDFDAPAINVIGYEHAPRTAEEQRSLTQAEAAFSQSAKLFELPSTAQCVVTSTEHRPITFEKDGDEDTAPGAPHADFGVRYHFTCAHPEALAWIDINLFPVLEGAQKIIVSVVTRSVQRQVELTPGQTRVPLASGGRAGH